MELISANNRAEKCLRSWRADHEKYFYKKDMVPETYVEALQSFMSYLRQQEITYAEASIEIETETVRWFHLSVYLSLVLSALLSVVDKLFAANTDWTSGIFQVCPVLFWGGIIIFCLYAPILFIRNDAHSFAMSERKFLQIALRRYLELYGAELGEKTVQTRRGHFVIIPLVAESIYGAKMRLSTHYDHVFLITIQDAHISYTYVLYTNSNYATMNENTKRIFVELCKQQTGRNWGGTDVQKFSLKKLA